MTDTIAQPTGYKKMEEEAFPLPAGRTVRSTPAVRVATANEIDDSNLVTRMIDGEAAALEKLYDRYGAAVLGLAYKMLGDRTLAEEVTQETFWRIWRNAGSFSSRQGKFSSWMFGITRNLAIDTWRRGQRRPQPAPNPADEQANTIPDPEADVPETAWTAIKHHQVRAAVELLPANQREVIELAFFGGMTRQEIAETMDVPLGTVHTRARLGLQKLREALRAQGFEE